MKKQKRWMKFRHKVTVKILHWFFGPYVKWKYGLKVERFREEGKRPYLIVMNHQTGYDQFFVGMTFRQRIYYVASEDLFSMGWVSGLIRWLVAPIPIKKQTTDLQAVKDCIRVAREGGSVCLAPEGNRTYHGRTVNIRPTIGPLAKKLGLPIAVFRIENGYGVHPRWSDVVRGGGMRCGVKRVIEPEEYKDLSGEQLYELLLQELTADEGKVTGEFPHKKNAEFLERAMYICPECGLTTFESKDDLITCKGCGLQVRHLPTKELEGVNKPFPHRFVADWYDWQEQQVNEMELTAMTETPLYEERVQVSLVHPCRSKDLLKEDARLCLYGDRVTLDDRVLPFESLYAVTVLGKNKLNLYSSGELLQIKGDKRFNALKYVNFYFRYKNLTTGDPYGKFLGI